MLHLFLAAVAWALPTEHIRRNSLGKILYFAGIAHATICSISNPSTPTAVKHLTGLCEQRSSENLKHGFQTTSHYLPYHSPRFLNSAGVQPKYSRNALVKLETWA